MGDSLVASRKKAVALFDATLLEKPSFVMFCLMFAVWRRSAGLTSEVALKRSPEQKEQDYDYDDEADAAK
jgi:hypothetical protein